MSEVESEIGIEESPSGEADAGASTGVEAEVVQPRSALEAVIFVSDGPASAATIRRALPELAPGRIPDLVEEINEQLDKSGRPYRIASVAGGYQFRTTPAFREVLLAARPERKLRLSKRALESLSVVAYRQPVTRAELEDLRGVDCGAVLKSLLERGLIRIVGRRDAPGRPVLYGTSARFLETFGLHSLRDLPELRDVLPPAVEQGSANETREEPGKGTASEDESPERTDEERTDEEEVDDVEGEGPFEVVAAAEPDPEPSDPERG